VRDVKAGTTRGPAVLATAAALALVNLGLALLIALAVGARGFVPVWVAALLLVLGIVATTVAVTLWRGYLNARRTH
jgi:fatty acid desaturase